MILSLVLLLQTKEKPIALEENRSAKGSGWFRFEAREPGPRRLIVTSESKGVLHVLSNDSDKDMYT